MFSVLKKKKYVLLFQFQQLRVWKCLAITQKSLGHIEYEKTAKKLTELQAQFGNEDSGDESDAADNNDGNFDENDDEALEALIEREMLLPDSGERRYLRSFKTSFVDKNFPSTILLIKTSPQQ